MTDREAVKAACAELEPHLAGLHPAVQGATLALLLAKWLAGHIGIDREALLQTHIVGVRSMIPVVLKEHEMDDGT